MNSKQKRKRFRSRRAILSRVGQLLFVLGALCLLFAALLAVAARWGPVSARDRQIELALFYLAGGGFFLLLRWLVVRVQKRIAHKSHGSRAPRQAARTARRAKARRAAGGRRREAEAISLSENAGAVLILTLVVLALVAGLLAQVQLRSLAARKNAEAAVRRARLEQAAGDAVRAALGGLLEEEAPIYDATNSPWARPREVVTPTGIETRVIITDENRFFDLNNVNIGDEESTLRPATEILMDIMTLCGNYTPLRQVEALADWTDADDEGFRETAFYRGGDTPYAAANRFLYGLSETLWIDGFTRDLFARRAYTAPGEMFKANLLDCVTVIPVARAAPVKVNLNTASRDTLLGIFGLEQEEEVGRILAMRKLHPLDDLDRVAALLDPQVVSRIRPYLDVKSSYFRVRGRAYADNYGVSVRALVHHNPAGYVEVLQWVL